MEISLMQNNACPRKLIYLSKQGITGAHGRTMVKTPCSLDIFHLDLESGHQHGGGAKVYKGLQEALEHRGVVPGQGWRCLHATTAAKAKLSRPSFLSCHPLPPTHIHSHILFFKKYFIFIYLFGCTRSQLQHTGPSSCSMRDPAPSPGIKPGPHPPPRTGA